MLNRKIYERDFYQVENYVNKKTTSDRLKLIILLLMKQ